MTCHLVFPYRWDDCFQAAECGEIAHLDESAEEVNSYPRSWVQSLLGCSLLEEEKVEWTDSSGHFHREDGVAVRRRDGSLLWYFHGLPHREDGPAVETLQGKKMWFQNGVRHREDGPAEIRINEGEGWWLNGMLHREDGPAITIGRKREWYQNGKLHRDDGPAIIFEDGTHAWYQHGVISQP